MLPFLALHAWKVCKFSDLMSERYVDRSLSESFDNSSR